MQIGIVGLGRMGANIARRLMRHGHSTVVYDVDTRAVDALTSEGAIGSKSVRDLVGKLDKSRVLWVMLPAGEITEDCIFQAAGMLDPGDVIIDGGNSYWKDDISRAGLLRERGIDYLDVGTSGGVWGLERGYCMMIGGDRRVVDALEPIFLALAPGDQTGDPSEGRDSMSRARRGYIHAGPNGAGHFVKMIHNGIEYGLMQAYGEGFDLLRNAKSLPEYQSFDFDLAAIAEVWRHGSVITSWLLDLTASALADDPTLAQYSGYVEDSGEGRWTLMAAIDEAVPVHVLSAALYARFRSRQEHTFSEKVLSAMRKGFGGHGEPKK